MTAAQTQRGPEWSRPLGDVRSPSSVHSQAAFVRTLLDEVERLTRSPRGSEAAAAVSEQLVEELARLACQCLEMESALTHVVDDSLAQEQAGGAREDVRRCA